MHGRKWHQTCNWALGLGSVIPAFLLGLILANVIERALALSSGDTITLLMLLPTIVHVRYNNNFFTSIQRQCIININISNSNKSANQ